MDRSRGKYRVEIKHNQRGIYLGRFNDIVEAAAHRLAAEQALGYNLCEKSSAFNCIQTYINSRTK